MISGFIGVFTAIYNNYLCSYSYYLQTQKVSRKILILKYLESKLE